MNPTLLATAVTAKSGSTCTATFNGLTVTVQVSRDLTISVGDVLLVSKVGAQWFVVQRLYAAPVTGTDAPVNDMVPPVKPAVVRGTLVVAPVETRSYRSAWRTDNSDVYQGQYGTGGNNTGVAFYGTQPRSLSGATVVDAKLSVRRLPGGAYSAQETTLRLVTESVRPGGAPTLTSSAAGPLLAVDSVTSDFDVSNSWVQSMVDGTAGGLAVFVSGGSPYVRLAGKASWSPAFTLTITYERG